MWRDTQTSVLVDGKWILETTFEENLERENPNVKRNKEAVEHCKKSIAYVLMRQKQLEILFDTTSYKKFVTRGLDPSSRPFLFDPSVESTTEVQIVSFFHLEAIDLFRWSIPNRFKSKNQLWTEYHIDDHVHLRLRRDFEMTCRKIREEQAIQIKKGYIRLGTEND